LENISFLAGLFDVDIKLEGMPIEIDIRKTFLYKGASKKDWKRESKKDWKRKNKKD
jgi:hypothetical protein